MGSKAKRTEQSNKRKGNIDREKKIIGHGHLKKRPKEEEEKVQKQSEQRPKRGKRIKKHVTMVWAPQAYELSLPSITNNEDRKAHPAAHACPLVQPRARL